MSARLVARIARSSAIAGLCLIVIALLWAAVALLEPLPAYRHSAVSSQPFAAFYAEQRARSAQAGVAPGNEELLLQAAPRSDLALLYIHGFGASRADGEYVVARLARSLDANAYLMRLPGHGSRSEDLAKYGFEAYLRASEQALDELGQLGRRRILIGTSLGASIATFLAATHPESVAGLVLFSPLYDFVGFGQLLNMPGGLWLGELFFGAQRNAEQPSALAARIHADYAKHWYTHQPTSALRVVRDLKRVSARPSLFTRVRCPVLLLYDRTDDVANVAEMQSAFEQFKPDPLSRRVAIAYGNHILASEYVKTDKGKILAEAQRFLETVRARPNLPDR